MMMQTKSCAITDRSDMEQRFELLSDITDRVALINSPYPSDLDTALDDLENFFSDVTAWYTGGIEESDLLAMLSHLSFHREIIADTIGEARQLLLDDRRPSLKRLVAYHKGFSRWLVQFERSLANNR